MMTVNKYTTFLLTLLAAYSQFAFAVEAPALIASNIDVSEEDYIGEVPKVLTVSRLSQSLADAPSAVTVIDRETIRAAGIADLPEIFRLVPGFYVAANAGFVHNTNHVVSYHGMATAYAGAMQVLINGRSVYSPLYGGVQWSELPIAIGDIARIEITRGPNAASYGANSFFGVINIITLSPAEQSGASVSAMLGKGRHKAFARYADKVGNASYRITAGYRDDDGLDNRNDTKRTRLLNGQVDYRLDDENILEMEFGAANGDREEGLAALDPLIFVPRTKGIFNHFELLRWRHNVSAESDFSLQAYHSHEKSDDIVTANLSTVPIPLLNRFPIIDNTVEFERFEFEAQQRFAINSKLRGVGGASVRQDNIYAPHYLGTHQKDKFDLQRLFAHVEWSATARVLFNAGAMFEHNDFIGSHASPRASVNFKIDSSNTIRFGISSALRTPNYLEQKFNAVLTFPTTNPSVTYIRPYVVDDNNVRPERVLSKEIGYLGNFEQLSFDVRLFDDDIRDYIQTNRKSHYVPPAGHIIPPNGKGLITNPLYSINGGDVSVQGFEAQGKWHVTTNTQALLNYAYVKIKANEDQTAKNFPESMPRNTISALLTHRFNPQWDASLAYYQTSAVTALGDGNTVGSTHRTDARVAYKFNATHLKGEVSGVVENLFNEHYQEFADYNTLKRRGRVNVRLDF